MKSLLLPLLLLLSACFTLPKPGAAPEAFMPAVDPAPRARLADELSLEVSAAPAHLDHRVPQWRHRDGSIRAYQGFQFAAPPGDTVGFVLADAIERSGAARVVRRDVFSDRHLNIELRAFELQTSESTAAAHIAWSLRWRCAASSHAERIDVSVPIEQRSTSAVMAAMQQALSEAVEKTLAALRCG